MSLKEVKGKIALYKCQTINIYTKKKVVGMEACVGIEARRADTRIASLHRATSSHTCMLSHTLR